MSAARDQYISANNGAWKNLVTLAYQISPTDIDRESELLSRAISSSKVTVRKKFEAIRYARERGLTEDAIVKAGQGRVLSSFAASRKQQKVEPDTILRYRVALSLGEAWNELVRHLANVADLKTSDDLIEFLHSVFVDLTDGQIKNLAGELDCRRKGRKV